MKIELPADYWAYLESDEVVSEGFADGFPGYFVLWHPDEIEKNNQEMDVATLAPGFLGFGGNGGGEMLAFDAKGIVYSLPMIGMEPRYAEKVANSWTEFRKRCGRDGPRLHED
jgi:hypothetical protein